MLQSTPLYASLISVAVDGRIDEQRFRQTIQRLVERRLVPQASADEILRYPWPEVAQVVQDVLSPMAASYHGLLLEEYQALLRASVEGSPAQHGPVPTSPVVFAVDRSLVRQIPGPGGRRLRITPISRLRTVTVQTGYRREISVGTTVPDPTRVVTVDFTDSANQVWYPGSQCLGEGIFLCLDSQDSWHFTLSEQTSRRWMEADAADYDEQLFRAEQADELNPVFVWWHTLAHLLLRALSVDVGYSTTAIRERVYVQRDGATGRARGGCVLYATQPGADGTLGGLIALVPAFERTLATAITAAGTCSNDPLCGDEQFSQGRHSGPACYGCLLVSETSCEHRNMWLDRSLLGGNLP